MSQHKIWPTLVVAAAAALAGNAMAQTGTSPGNSTPGIGNSMPSDTAPPSEPAQRVDPSVSGTDSMGSDAAGSSKPAASHKKHHAKKKKASEPKPADNDNNATPNTVSPPTSPQ